MVVVWNFIVDYYNLRSIYKTKMNEKILLWLCNYSYRITTYIFWIYFLFIIVLNFFDIEISKTIAYIFCLLLGFYLGYTVALRVDKHMKKKKETKQKAFQMDSTANPKVNL